MLNVRQNITKHCQTKPKWEITTNNTLQYKAETIIKI